METNKVLNYIKVIVENAPKAWLNLTTHRLDIYNEELAKTQFLEQFEGLFNENNSKTSALITFAFLFSSQVAVFAQSYPYKKSEKHQKEYYKSQKEVRREKKKRA